MAHDQYTIQDRIIGNFAALMMRQPKTYTGAEIKLIRQSHKLSREALAIVFNVSPSTIRNWEENLSTPSGAALRLIELLQFKDLEFFIVGQ